MNALHSHAAHPDQVHGQKLDRDPVLCAAIKEFRRVINHGPADRIILAVVESSKGKILGYRVREQALTPEQIAKLMSAPPTQRKDGR